MSSIQTTASKEPKQMSHSFSFSRNPLLSMTLSITGLMVIGCVDAPAPESIADSAEEMLINETNAAPLPMGSEVRLTRTAESHDLSIVGQGWKETAPGIWESSRQDGTGSIILGAEGHRAAIEQAEKELAALHEGVALQPGDAVSHAIEQKEAHLATLRTTAQAIAAEQNAASLALSCNIGFLNGPSSPFTGFYGALGGAQISCSGGCQWFTVQAQACSDFGCTQVAVGSNYVCSTPWLFGAAISGNYGASCYGAAYVSPPGITGSRYFPCG